MSFSFHNDELGLLLRELDFQTSRNDTGLNNRLEHDLVHLHSNLVFAKPFHISCLIFCRINYETIRAGILIPKSQMRE